LNIDLKLTNRTALVTGSTAGISLAIAVNGRTQERVSAAIARIKQTNADAKLQGVVADLSTQEGVEKLCSKVPALDILVNNLGIYEAKPFAEISDQDWTKILEVNVLSGVRLSRQYLPQMLHQDWGRIIFISSFIAQTIRHIRRSSSLSHLCC
jgi:NAD(P)-dependent dehydrogenase (short-subunit alcohol dehydrogenase family)